MQDDFKDRLISLKDDELRKIIYVDFNDYENKDIIDFAKRELLNRYKDNIYENDSLTFKMLLQNITVEDITARLIELYPKYEQDVPSYINVLDKLNNTQASENQNAYITIENLGYRISEGCVSCDIFGVDIATQEKFEITYCLWKEWLSFLIIKEQLQKIGAVDYIIQCLRKMTSVSFDENEINQAFNELMAERREISNPEQLLNTNTDLTNCESPEDDNEVEAEEAESTDYYDVHPWLRYFARSIDTLIFFSILQLIYFYFNKDSFRLLTSYGRGIPFKMVEYCIWLIFEAFLLSTYGYTFGKWVLNIEIRTKMNERLTFNEALLRAWKVFFYGEGLSIPIIGLFTNIAQYDRLTRTGSTKWDDDGDLVVSHTEIEKYKIFMAVIILIIYPISAIILYRVG